ncbi:hypothetical protein TIFTF001_005593 [Ficus carica]|uniref:Uncharacterized protein n=1 Tax=Ficus carica TaxID=3494 RepID=A0AA88CZL3_FICCA|nr:hypothetical protein TIFTF001_005593 [Ficus carica]
MPAPLLMTEHLPLTPATVLDGGDEPTESDAGAVQAPTPVPCGAIRR